MRPISHFWRRVHLDVHAPISAEDLVLEDLKEVIESKIQKP